MKIANSLLIFISIRSSSSLSCYADRQIAIPCTLQWRRVSLGFVNIQFNVWHDIVLIRFSYRYLSVNLRLIMLSHPGETGVSPTWECSSTQVKWESHKGGTLYAAMRKYGSLSSFAMIGWETLHSIGLC